MITFELVLTIIWLISSSIAVGVSICNENMSAAFGWSVALAWIIIHLITMLK